MINHKNIILLPFNQSNFLIKNFFDKKLNKLLSAVSSNNAIEVKKKKINYLNSFSFIYKFFYFLFYKQKKISNLKFTKKIVNNFLFQSNNFFLNLVKNTFLNFNFLVTLFLSKSRNSNLAILLKKYSFTYFLNCDFKIFSNQLLNEFFNLNLKKKNYKKLQKISYFKKKLKKFSKIPLWFWPITTNSSKKWKFSGKAIPIFKTITFYDKYSSTFKKKKIKFFIKQKINFNKWKWNIFSKRKTQKSKNFILNFRKINRSISNTNIFWSNLLKKKQIFKKNSIFLVKMQFIKEFLLVDLKKKVNLKYSNKLKSKKNIIFFLNKWFSFLTPVNKKKWLKTNHWYNLSFFDNLKYKQLSKNFKIFESNFNLSHVLKFKKLIFNNKFKKNIFKKFNFKNTSNLPKKISQKLGKVNTFYSPSAGVISRKFSTFSKKLLQKKIKSKFCKTNFFFFLSGVRSSKKFFFLSTIKKKSIIFLPKKKNIEKNNLPILFNFFKTIISKSFISCNLQKNKKIKNNYFFILKNKLKNNYFLKSFKKKLFKIKNIKLVNSISLMLSKKLNKRFFFLAFKKIKNFKKIIFFFKFYKNKRKISKKEILFFSLQNIYLSHKKLNNFFFKKLKYFKTMNFFKIKKYFRQLYYFLFFKSRISNFFIHKKNTLFLSALANEAKVKQKFNLLNSKYIFYSKFSRFWLKKKKIKKFKKFSIFNKNKKVFGVLESKNKINFLLLKLLNLYAFNKVNTNFFKKIFLFFKIPSFFLKNNIKNKKKIDLYFRKIYNIKKGKDSRQFVWWLLHKMNKNYKKKIKVQYRKKFSLNFRKLFVFKKLFMFLENKFLVNEFFSGYNYKDLLRVIFFLFNKNNFKIKKKLIYNYFNFKKLYKKRNKKFIIKTNVFLFKKFNFFFKKLNLFSKINFLKKKIIKPIFFLDSYIFKSFKVRFRNFNFKNMLSFLNKSLKFKFFKKKGWFLKSGRKTFIRKNKIKLWLWLFFKGSKTRLWYLSNNKIVKSLKSRFSSRLSNLFSYISSRSIIHKKINSISKLNLTKFSFLENFLLTTKNIKEKLLNKSYIAWYGIKIKKYLNSAYRLKKKMVKQLFFKRYWINFFHTRRVKSFKTWFNIVKKKKIFKWLKLNKILGLKIIVIFLNLNIVKDFRTFFNLLKHKHIFVNSLTTKNKNFLLSPLDSLTLSIISRNWVRLIFKIFSNMFRNKIFNKFLWRYNKYKNLLSTRFYNEINWKILSITIISYTPLSLSQNTNQYSWQPSLKLIKWFFNSTK